LVEPFRGLIDVIICSFIWAANDHDSDAVIVYTIIVYRWLEKVRILFKPFLEVQWASKSSGREGGGKGTS